MLHFSLFETEWFFFSVFRNKTYRAREIVQLIVDSTEIDPGSIPGISDDPLSIPGVIPEYRANSILWEAEWYYNE